MKYFASICDNRQILQKIELKLLSCLSLILRNDKVGVQILEAEKQSRCLKYLTNYAEEQLQVILKDQDILGGNDSLTDINLLTGTLRIFRQVLISNQDEIMSILPQLADFIDKVLVTVLSMLK